MNLSKAQADAEAIWAEAKEAGKGRYFRGRNAHKTDLWTAGARWYAAQAREEALDSVAYHHHLNKRVWAIAETAQQMLDGAISKSRGAKMILSLINGEPKASPRPRSME